MRHQAVYNTHPKVKSIAAGDPWEYFDINSNSVEIDESLVTPELEKLQAEYDALEYARNRALAYPSTGDQLDMQYHDQLDGTTTWKDAVAKVKTDNPKG